jgi:hypothetical protein
VPPWLTLCAVSPHPGGPDKIAGGYAVRDANGQNLPYVLPYVYSLRQRGRGTLTKDEARRGAVDIAGLPELLGKADHD